MTDVVCASIGDEESLMDLLRQMHRENGLTKLDDLKVRHMVQRLIHRRFGVIGVIRGRNCVEASCGLVLSKMWYSDEWQLEDLWSFVGEPYRRSSHAKLLIEFAKHYSMGIGIPLLMAVMSNDQTAAKVRLYKRQLPEVGAMFLFNGALSSPEAA